ncbi:hypothetical protein [Mucilaginibacter sp. KACC 22063]|uniref:hypothetical protein n=1 Tax=Mucilaginibacter sp. KACC 22063 TaxID=3025666 RepID=UPI00236727DC|nr:hypothetical protein [Mucilaginibacter sp. KACC 22063]WDF54840.1 hypothetical protein PQ461_18075 [Mucilaginibacter sp. KACC 22063]
MTEQPIQPPKKRTPDLAILGYNLLAFALYTIVLVASDKDNVFFAFILSIIHFVVCIIMAIAKSRWAWALAGLLVLIIGFGTCVNSFHMGPMH